MRFIPVVMICLLLMGCSLNSANHVNPQNTMGHYTLPPYALLNKQEQEKLIDPLLVMKRVATLHKSSDELLDLNRWKLLYEAGLKEIDSFTYPGIEFNGATGEELNSFLQDNTKKTVTLTRNVTTSTPIILPSNVILEGRGFSIDATDVRRTFLLNDARQSAIRNLTIAGNFETAIYATHGDGVLLQNITIKNAKGRPIVVMGNTQNIYLLNNTVENNGLGGIYIRGNVTNGIIEGNKIRSNKGATNFSAGLVITHARIEDINEPENARLLPINDLLEFPHDLVVIRNQVTDQQSSGIYLDGAMSIYIRENQLLDNDKEGCCLDNGTTGAHFINNTVIGNGGRSRQSDEDLRKDFVLQFGRMPNGSANAKLPGVSLDNAAYNVLLDNTFRGNYGSGVKMVRTGVRNFIGMNDVKDNNAGQNERFHFFGIELGFAALDEAATYLNAAPDYENVIFANTVQGPHMAGIFMANEVYQNNIYDNVVKGAKDFSIQSISSMNNFAYNNETDNANTGLLTERLP